MLSLLSQCQLNLVSLSVSLSLPFLFYSAEKAFADCTVVAKKELRHLRVVRIAAAKKALVAMATAKRDEAQRAHDALADIRAAVNAL